MSDPSPALPRYAATDRVVATDLPDGTAVLLHLDSKFYYTLNSTGAVMYRTLRKGQATRAELASALVAEFACDPDVAEGDVASLLDDLVAEALVLVTHA